MILASHGLIASQIATTDVDALAFFNRVTTAGGSLSDTEKSAVNTLVIQMKADGIWTAMKAIYPMVGSSAAACSQNLKSSSFTGTFTATGWTFASTGVTPNGTSAYMETNFNPSIELTQNNISIGFYSGTNLSSPSGQPIAMGAQNATSYLRIIPFEATLVFMDLNDDSGVFIPALTRTDGFYFGSRIISTAKILSRRGTLTNLTNSSNGVINRNIYLGAVNFNGSISRYSVYQHRFTFVGEGLDTTQCNNYYTAVQAFQTTLGRAVAP